jgi:hypothetical protein
METLTRFPIERYPNVVIIGSIIALRNAIRDHRDAKGDDRCWLDDYKLWAVLHDSLPIPCLTLESAMARCREFYNNRRADQADPIPDFAISDSRFWDDDLTPERQDIPQIWRSLMRAIRDHRDLPAGTVRTCEHDRALYLILPEKMPADFRLPPKEEFLEYSNNPKAGCPNFWDSHAECPAATCNLHDWGPCSLPNQR